MNKFLSLLPSLLCFTASHASASLSIPSRTRLRAATGPLRHSSMVPHHISRPLSSSPLSSHSKGLKSRGTQGGMPGLLGEPHGIRTVWRLRPNAHTFQVAESTMLTITEEEGHDVTEYMQDCDRIVNMTFPDHQRREKVGDNTWKVQLLQQDLAGIKFRPQTTLQVSSDKKGCLNVRVSELNLDLPPQFQVVPPILKVDGSLKPTVKLPRQKVMLRGALELALETDLPAPLAMIPGVKQLVESVLRGILLQLRNSLERGISSDYKDWSAARANAPSQPVSSRP